MTSKSKTSASPKFELLDKLGSGLFANVVRARESALGRFVALKIIKDDFDSSTAAVDHARVMAQLPKHKNVVQIFGIEKIRYARKKRTAVSMEWIEGQSLALALSGPRFAIPQARKLIAGIVSGLTFMHSHNVFHGDLHPGNVVIGADGEPVIIDASVEMRGTLSRMHADIDQSILALDLDQLKHVIFRCIQHSKIAPSTILAAMDSVAQQSSIAEIAEFVSDDLQWKSGTNSLVATNLSISSFQELTIQFLENSQLASLKEYCFCSAKRLVDSVNDTSEFPMDSDVSKEEFSRRVEQYESIAAELANAIGYTSAWADGGDHERIVIDSIQMVAEGTGRLYMDGTFKSVWRHCRQYPLALLFCTSLFACYRNERFKLMRKLLLDIDLLLEGRAVSFLQSTRYFIGDFSDSWNSILGTRLYTPVDDRISEMIQEYLPSLSRTSALSNRSFDELQCFMSAVSLYRSGTQTYQNPEQDWGVSGSYLWRHQCRTGDYEDPCDRLILQIEKLQSNWPPLRAGFFDGESDLAIKTLSYSKIVHASMRERLRIF